jgi:hypothetical protein
MSNHASEVALNSMPLVIMILGKTKAGKLKWEDTADENVFIASVGGNTTLKFRREFDALNGTYRYTLGLLDENGKLFWEIEEPRPMLEVLFADARRMALKVDQRVEALLETLQRL